MLSFTSMDGGEELHAIYSLHVSTITGRALYETYQYLYGRDAEHGTVYISSHLRAQCVLAYSGCRECVSAATTLFLG